MPLTNLINTQPNNEDRTKVLTKQAIKFIAPLCINPSDVPK